LVDVSITATSLEYFVGTKRDWAKAEQAKAKAKSIVIISVFMFGLLSLLERSLLAHRMHTFRCARTNLTGPILDHFVALGLQQNGEQSALRKDQV
jgi:hypothetical protein